MNTRTTDPIELLDAMTAAARHDVSEPELEAAVRRFRERLPASDSTRTGQRNAFSRWLGLAGVAATLVLALTIGPLLLPGTATGSGFAQAQSWFADYRTLQLTLVTRQGEMELYRMKVWHQRGGATRIELGPMTQIVDPVAGMMMQIDGEGRIMSRQPLRPSVAKPDLAAIEREELAWLGELRDFRGQAERVEMFRSINGVDARGWTLSLSGMRHTLWVDPADFRPLLLEGALGAGVTMETRFVFDEVFPGTLFPTLEATPGNSPEGP